MFGLMGLLRRTAAARIQLELIELNLTPTAIKQGADHCCNSGLCCWRRPGCLEPADVPKIAEFLKLTPQELFEQKLVVDSIGNADLCLLPKRKHQIGGIMISSEETWSYESPCEFLTEDNKCQIHEVKPKNCREFECWQKVQPPPHYSEFTKEELMALGWSGKINED